MKRSVEDSANFVAVLMPVLMVLVPLVVMEANRPSRVLSIPYEHGALHVSVRDNVHAIVIDTGAVGYKEVWWDHASSRLMTVQQIGFPRRGVLRWIRPASARESYAWKIAFPCG